MIWTLQRQNFGKKRIFNEKNEKNEKTHFVLKFSELATLESLKVHFDFVFVLAGLFLPEKTTQSAIKK